MTFEEIFLKYSTDKLDQLSGRVQDCLGRLTQEQIWARGSDNENAVGNLVLHLCGNVRQWIGAGIGGRPDQRDRDSEFRARDGVSPAQLCAGLCDAVSAASEIIRNLPPARFTQQLTIQNYNVTVLEAIYHVVEHFSQHTGQIVFATKLLTREDLGYYRHLNKPRHQKTTP